MKILTLFLNPCERITGTIFHDHMVDTDFPSNEINAHVIIRLSSIPQPISS